MILDDNLFDETVPVDISNGEINIPTLDDKPLESPLFGKDLELSGMLINALKDELSTI